MKCYASTLLATLAICSLSQPSFGNIINPHDSGTDQTHHIKWGTVVPDGSTVTTVTYYLHDHGGAETMTSEIKDRFRDAFNLWEGYSLLDFVEVSTDANENIHVHVSDLVGANGVFKSASGSAHHYVGDDGHGVHDFHDGSLTGGLDGWAEVALDVSSNWYTGSGTPSSTQFDFLSIAIHEVGHATGLAHSNNPSSPMYNPSDGVFHQEANEEFSHLGLGETLRLPTSHDIGHQVELYGAVPEPSTLVLLLGGVVSATGIRLTRVRRQLPAIS